MAFYYFSHKKTNMKEALQFKQFQIFSPEQTLAMPPDKLMLVATQAADLINQLGGEHMFHPTPDTLCAYMQAGMATYAVNEAGVLGGFIKVDPWLVDPDNAAQTHGDGIFGKLKALEAGQAKLGLLETGSLVVHPSDQGNGLGTELKVQMAAQASLHYPGIPVVAVVTNDNGPSLHNNHKLGWVPVPNETIVNATGIDLLEGWAPESTIFVSPQSANGLLNKVS